jgi:Tfp pilus assembly protein PilO
MKFRKLSKEKRTQLVAVVLITVASLGGLGFGLVRHQYESLAQLADKRANVDRKREQMRVAIKNADRMEKDLAELKKTLTVMEADTASGDLYSWAINTLKQFKLPYNVDIPQFSPLGPTTDVSLLPSFPYKQTTFSVQGTAYFHDFGRFLADFENHFPHLRVVNLSLDLDATSQEPEKLYFKMDIAALIRNNS